ncbi:MAG: hypothetical protein LC655_08985 [Bacteroidales bacterium]|nr:hypothetical protein [Bacteroidales bacterium]
MMFLEALAKYITEQAEGDPAGRCFVFPNRRSGLFFKRFLVKHTKGTGWSPRILTINELMVELSSYQQADPLDMLFTLHDIYIAKAAFPEPFDTFYTWGEMMISDFDTLESTWWIPMRFSGTSGS